jgi:hypothetical protein
MKAILGSIDLQMQYAVIFALSGALMTLTRWRFP